MSRSRSILAQSPALTIAIVALVISLGSGAYAAGLINGAQIAPGSIPANRLKPHSVTSAQLHPTTVIWHNVALENGWASSNPTYKTGNPRYGVSYGIVYLSGSLHQVSGNDATIGVLPAGYRPAHELYLPIYTFEDSSGALIIEPSGVMEVESLTAIDATTYSSLAGVSYPLGA